MAKVAWDSSSVRAALRASFVENNRIDCGQISNDFGDKMSLELFPPQPRDGRVGTLFRGSKDGTLGIVYC